MDRRNRSQGREKKKTLPVKRQRAVYKSEKENTFPPFPLANTHKRADSEEGALATHTHTHTHIGNKQNQKPETRNQKPEPSDKITRNRNRNRSGSEIDIPPVRSFVGTPRADKQTPTASTVPEYYPIKIYITQPNPSHPITNHSSIPNPKSKSQNPHERKSKAKQSKFAAQQKPKAGARTHSTADPIQNKVGPKHTLYSGSQGAIGGGGDIYVPSPLPLLHLHLSPQTARPASKRQIYTQYVRNMPFFLPREGGESRSWGW